MEKDIFYPQITQVLADYFVFHLWKSA